MFKKEHCSPRKDKISSSCLSKKLLISIAKILNRKRGTKIKTKGSSKKKLYSAIQKELKKTECKKESCWITLNIIYNNLSLDERKQFKNSFRPFIPDEWEKKPNTWLNTTDIDNVMKQYEKKYPQFKYYGATPIDFHLKSDGNQCIVSKLCKIDINQLKKDNKKSVGLVFNTDNHLGPGQHWFSMFIDLYGVNRENPSIYYFDSAESIQEINELPKQILDLIEKLQKQNNYHFDILYNDIQHQYGNTECGVYCLHFLTEMLKGKSFENYVKRKLKDKSMERFRNMFFIQTK